MMIPDWWTWGAMGHIVGGSVSYVRRIDFDVRRSVIQVLDNVFFTSSNQASKQTNKLILYRMTLPSVEGIIYDLLLFIIYY